MEVDASIANLDLIQDDQQMSTYLLVCHTFYVDLSLGMIIHFMQKETWYSLETCIHITMICCSDLFYKKFKLTSDSEFITGIYDWFSNPLKTFHLDKLCKNDLLICFNGSCGNLCSDWFCFICLFISSWSVKFTYKS